MVIWLLVVILLVVVLWCAVVFWCVKDTYLRVDTFLPVVENFYEEEGTTGKQEYNAFLEFVVVNDAAAEDYVVAAANIESKAAET